MGGAATRAAPPPWRPGGPGRKPMDLRGVIHGIFSGHTTGCPWRTILPNLGKANTLDGCLRRQRRADRWTGGMDTRRQWERPSQGWLPAPSVCCADSPSSTTAMPAEDVGFDGPKNLKGRKRPSLVETLGLMVAVVVTAASLDARLDWVALVPPYCAAGVTGFRHTWVEAGDDAQWRRD
jgi:putative transposase